MSDEGTTPVTQAMDAYVRSSGTNWHSGTQR
jgi:hypothetical protein